MRSVSSAPKRQVTLLLNSKVLDMAAEMGLDVSSLADDLLAEKVVRLFWERWGTDNADAIATYNARVASEGLFSDRYRTFLRGKEERRTSSSTSRRSESDDSR